MKKHILILAFSVILLAASFGSAQVEKNVSDDFRSSEKMIQDAPYSATAVTESVQMLADGTRITRTTESKLYRDSKGRFRRDDMRKKLGFPGDNLEIGATITIIDPVSGLKHIANTENRTYKQIPLKVKEINADTQAKKHERQAMERERQAKEREDKQKQRENQEWQLSRQSGKNEAQQSSNNGANSVNGVTQQVKEKNPSGSDKPKSDKSGIISRTESLGSREIEGVRADGSRTTTVIPAGTIGNDRDINVVYEKWYSPELQLTVFSKHNDPRFGEQTFRLLNISRQNQPISLFTPPADFKIRPEDKDWLNPANAPFKLKKPNKPNKSEKSKSAKPAN